VQVGDDAGHRVLPLEAHRQVDHDADDHEGQRLQAVGRQLLPHLGPHELGAPQLDVGRGRLQRLQHLLALLRRGLALLHRQADQHVARGAEVLHLGFAEAERADGAAHLGQVGGLAVADLHHRAAGEFHRQVQAARDEEEHRQHESGDRYDVEDQRIPHERDVPSDLEKLHLTFLSFCWSFQ